MTDETLTVHATNTHLYTGARLTASIDVAALGSRPRALHLAFSDGIRVAAELLQNDTGDLAIEVPAYETASGTAISAKAWRVSATADDDGEGSTLVVRARL